MEKRMLTGSFTSDFVLTLLMRDGCDTFVGPLMALFPPWVHLNGTGKRKKRSGMASLAALVTQSFGTQKIAVFSVINNT